MPFVNVETHRGCFHARAEKQEMIRRLTDTMLSIEKRGWVRLSNLGCGGRGQERRLGDWRESAYHERCEGACRWQATSVTPYQQTATETRHRWSDHGHKDFLTVSRLHGFCYNVDPVLDCGSDWRRDLNFTGSMRLLSKSMLALRSVESD